MTDHTLEEIVAAEKEIQIRLAEERRQAAAWLAAECEGINRATEEKVAAARRQFRERITAAEAEAGETVNDLLQRGEIYAARLQALPEEELRQLVRRQLVRLLPERPA